MEHKLDRPSKTIQERIDILKNNRKIIIEDEYEAEEILQGIPYYSLVNVNKDIFCTDPDNDVYKNGVKIEHMYRAHVAQKSVFSIFLKYIIFVEETFKNQLGELITDSFGEIYNEDIRVSKNNYLYYKNYSSGSGRRVNVCEKIIDSINDTIKNRSSSATYHYSKKSNIPPWIVVRDLYFSLALQWYRILKPVDKSIINEQLVKVNPTIKSLFKKDISVYQNFITTSLDILVDYRNAIAHGQKPYPYRVGKYLSDKSVNYLLPDEVKNSDWYKNSSTKNDLITLFLILQVFLFNEDLKYSLYTELNFSLDFYSIHDYGDLSLYDVLSMPAETKELIEEIYNYLKT